VAQVIFACPLQELDLRDQYRFQPTAIFHRVFSRICG
jgi:hypothetical protein